MWSFADWVACFVLVNDNKYHALLLLSGGKDSAYMLYRLKKEYPQLRILCVAVNNGFMSSTAIKGAQFVAEKTKSDLLIVNTYINDFAEKLRQAFLDLNGQGAYGVIDILNNGYSSFEPEFAQLIREKKADRKMWLYVFELLEFASRKGLLNKDLNICLAKLNLKISDIVKDSK